MEGKERVQNFINNFQGTSEEEACKLMKSFLISSEIVEDIIDVIENNHASQICDSACEVLFKLNSSCDNEKCTVFCLQFVPAVIWAYYRLISRQVKWSSSKVETLLLSIYNQVVSVNSDTAFSKLFRIPALSRSSIYHEPSMGVASILTEHDKADKPTPLKYATKLLDVIPAGLRSSVMKAALTKYNEYLSCYYEPSLKCFCRMVIRLSACGYPSTLDDNKFVSTESLECLQNYPKVLLNGAVTKEMVTSLHFIAFNGCAHIAVNALQYLHKKSCYSICPAAVLATNAVQDLIKLSSSGDKFEHNMPLNPYESTYRGAANLASIEEYRRESMAMAPQTPRPNIIGCLIDSVMTPIAPVTDLNNGMERTNDSVCNETIETDVSGPVNFRMGSYDEDDNSDHSTSGTGGSFLQTPAPTIVIDMHDLSDEISTDNTPLIDHSKTVSTEGIHLAEVIYACPPATENVIEGEVQTNGTAGNVHDTQF